MIIAAEVKRDEQGYWTHPALVRSGCETSAELSYWLRTHKLQCFVITMRDEAPEAFAAGFTDEAPNARGWIPEPPDDDGWQYRCCAEFAGISGAASERTRSNEDFPGSEVTESPGYSPLRG